MYVCESKKRKSREEKKKVVGEKRKNCSFYSACDYTHAERSLFCPGGKSERKKKKVVFSVVPHDFGVLSGYEK